MDLCGHFLVIQESVLLLANVLLQLVVLLPHIQELIYLLLNGTNFIAVADGEITFAQFLGAGGYTITLSFNNFKVSYCHCDPNFIVSVGDKIKQGQIIGCVGPKNVYGVKGNQYFDENGQPTNGATTGPHLHLGIRIDGNYTNPMNYF